MLTFCSSVLLVVLCFASAGAQELQGNHDNQGSVPAALLAPADAVAPAPGPEAANSRKLQYSEHHPHPPPTHLPTAPPTRHPTPPPTGAPVTPSPTVAGAAPAPTPRVNADVDILLCFSGDATVQVQDQGMVAMKELQLGDYVLSDHNSDKYSKVYAFGHYKPDARAEFLKIQTTNSSLPLEITKEHLIYKYKEVHPVRAGSIREGDLLAPNGVQVTKISYTQSYGVYAPLTRSGKLVVNNVQTSSYAGLQDKHETHVVFANGLPIMGLHNGVHAVIAPFRIMCNHFTLCQSYNEDGLPHYVAWGIDVIQYLDQQSFGVQLLAFGPALVIFGFFAMMEMMVDHAMLEVWLLVVTAAAQYVFAFLAILFFLVQEDDHSSFK